jgi:cell division protein FtsQ
VNWGAATPAGRLRSLPGLPRASGHARALAASHLVRRRLLPLAAALLVLAAGYQFWLRDSSFVAVERVTVTGLSTADAERVRAALTSAGRTMTTLHVDHEALERAVAGFPVVRELEVSADFPDRLRINVVEHVAAAIVAGDGGQVAVSSDGTILQGVNARKGLPTVEVDGAVGLEQVRDPSALASVAIAGAAPVALRARMTEVGEDGSLGQVAELRDGPEVVFGDASRVRAKWAAASRVLADLEASGATYVDVRIPGRPAVGGLEAETITPVAPAGTTLTVPPAMTATGTLPVAPVDPAAVDPAAVDPITGAVPPTGGVAPPADGATAMDGAVTAPSTTTAPSATAPAPGTVTQTPAAPLEGGAAGGAETPPTTLDP